MNKQSYIIINPTFDGLYDMLAAMEAMKVPSDASIDIIPTGRDGVYQFIVYMPAPHKGVKQRCATVDAQGRRCIRGPRHAENHRYENGADHE